VTATVSARHLGDQFVAMFHRSAAAAQMGAAGRKRAQRASSVLASDVCLGG
jgi:hypothetical protein